MGLFSVRSEVTEGPPVVFDCPACRATEIQSVPRHHKETLMLVHLVPLVPFLSLFIKCSACGHSLALASTELDEVALLSREELTKRLRPYVSGVGRVMVILALALFWFPFLAPFLAIAGFAMTRRHAGWRRLAIIAIVLSLLVAIAFGCLMLFVDDPNRPGRR